MTALLFQDLPIELWWKIFGHLDRICVNLLYDVIPDDSEWRSVFNSRFYESICVSLSDTRWSRLNPNLNIPAGVLALNVEEYLNLPYEFKSINKQLVIENIVDEETTQKLITAVPDSIAALFLEKTEAVEYFANSKLLEKISGLSIPYNGFQILRPNFELGSNLESLTMNMHWAAELGSLDFTGLAFLRLKYLTISGHHASASNSGYFKCGGLDATSTKFPSLVTLIIHGIGHDHLTNFTEHTTPKLRKVVVTGITGHSITTLPTSPLLKFLKWKHEADDAGYLYLSGYTSLNSLAVDGSVRIRNIDKLTNLKSAKFTRMNGIFDLSAFGYSKPLEISPNDQIESLNFEKLPAYDDVCRVEEAGSCNCLEELAIRSCDISQLTDLGKARHLKVLRIANCSIENIEGLYDLKGLKILDLGSNNIYQIEGLRELKNLVELDLNSNQISKVEGLNELRNLKILNLSSNGIFKLEGLTELKRLQTFDLSSNRISKLEGLNELKQLETLGLTMNQITKLEGLNELKKLKVLNLSSNGISKLEGLTELKRLQTLTLFSNRVSKLEGLDELKELTYFDLASNQISKLEGLDELKELTYFDLASNQISKLEGLNELKKLETLDLNSNQISKLEGLNELRKLTRISLEDNNITRIEGLDNLRDLTLLEIRDNDISSIHGLDQMTKLEIDIDEVGVSSEE